MPGRVIHCQAQMTRTLVQIKHARLEKGGSVAGIEILKVDKIDAQQMQVAHVPDELLHAGDGPGLALASLVAGQQRLNVPPRRTGQPLADAGQAQFPGRRARRGGLPGLERGQPRLHGGPAGLCQF